MARASTRKRQGQKPPAGERRGETGDRTPLTLRNWRTAFEAPPEARPDRNAIVDCGWGRLIFAHTFDSPEELADELRREETGRRDIAFYVPDPHVVISHAPQELFLDPSHTFRLWLDQYRPSHLRPSGYLIRKARPRRDGEAIADIYGQRHMVPVDKAFLVETRLSKVVRCVVAEDEKTGDVIGVAFGVDHHEAFGDPENGSSLWALAVDPRTAHAGVGEALTRNLAEHFLARGLAFMDLSVMYDNTEAIKLYEKLGFQRVPVFSVKTKNSINQSLFVGPLDEEDLNPYAQIIVDEARRRGIGVDIIDGAKGYFRLTLGGQSIVCRESLSELTSAIAMSRCDDKQVTRDVLQAAGLRVPAQIEAGDKDAMAEFLDSHQRVVVKPARGEQGNAVFVNLTSSEDVARAVKAAARVADKVLIEECVEGEDLRIVVIDYEVVAAAVRKPPEVIGTGHDTIRKLIQRQSRKRASATGGESRIPIDDETKRCLQSSGNSLDDVPEAGTVIRVRNAANLHTGGTIHDVTDELSDTLREAAVAAAKALEIPVVGLDFMVPDPAGDDYAIIEANERPGLANHEPRPTAERFIDLLFPLTAK